MQHVLDNFNALRADDLVDDGETGDADTNTPTLTAEERAVRTAADSGDDDADGDAFAQRCAARQESAESRDASERCRVEAARRGTRR